MRQFKERNINSFWHSPLVLVILFGLLIIFIYNVIGLVETQRETNKKKELSMQEIDTLNDRKELLTNEIRELRTNEGIEKTVREKFLVGKPQEKMVTIIDPQENDNLSQIDKKDHSFWTWFKMLFSKK